MKNMNNSDFEKEYMSDSEVEEDLDNIIELIEDYSRDENTAVINPKKMQAVLYTYKVLKYLTKGTNAKVTYALNEPYKSMGSVSIVGKELTFSNPKWFMVAVKLASNFNVYPKTNGTVQMDFTFHGLTISLD